MYKTTARRNPQMTCLEDTYQFIEESRDWGRYNIIHAIVQRNSDGLRHPHAVVYDKETKEILEVSNSYKDDNVKMPFMLWIMLGKVSDVKQYTLNEFRKLLVKHRRYTFFHFKERFDDRELN